MGKRSSFCTLDADADPVNHVDQEEGAEQPRVAFLGLRAGSAGDSPPKSAKRTPDCKQEGQDFKGPNHKVTGPALWEG